MESPRQSLARVRPRPQTSYVSAGRAVLATAEDGFIHGGPDEGLFVRQTRLLSLYRYRIDGQAPFPVTLSDVEQDRWLGYYLAPPSIRSDAGKGVGAAAQQAVELRLSRSVTGGVHEDVDLTNFTQDAVAFELRLEVAGDFADQQETHGRRKQHGQVSRGWERGPDGGGELVLDYRAEHRYRHQGNRGTAHLHRGLRLRIGRADTPAAEEGGALVFAVRLRPRERWHACIDLLPFGEDAPEPAPGRCPSAPGAPAEADGQRRRFLQAATAFESPLSGTLTHVVTAALEQARRDLAALRLPDLDREGGWVPAAGLPKYVGLFGRDTLLTSWMAGPLSAELMRGTLPALARLQGSEANDWRDEQPGRILHQSQDGPLEALEYNPLGRYYGSLTSPMLFPVVLAELWRWAGDEASVRRLLGTARRAVAWLDDGADLDGDGFYEYRTLSKQGLKNQGWKDSGDAIVYPDGRQVPDPLATCEAQGLAYAAKRRLGELLWWLGERDEAGRLANECGALKRRFNDDFWMEDEGYYAMALDKHKKQVRSVCSDPGECLAAGIVEGSRVRAVADRLQAPDLFSGWGNRTLSADHAAYNPFSYQRGAVWPVEQGVLATAYAGLGLHDHLERLCRAQFEAAALFDYYRLPECFTGHPRDAGHPFPALYPQANWPQAWSSATVFALVQSLLGLCPCAPLQGLFLDPHLPDWLPELTLRRLRVGAAAVDLRFRRGADGRTDFEVLRLSGPLRVVRQATPWSLGDSWQELYDAFRDLLSGA